MDPYRVIYHPWVTEKSQRQMEEENKLEFIVRKEATKHEIKVDFEKLYDVKVAKVNNMLCKDGKHAIIKLTEGYSAEDIGMRIGVF